MLPLHISRSFNPVVRTILLPSFSRRIPQYRNNGPLLRNSGGLNLVGTISGRTRMARVGQVSE